MKYNSRHAILPILCIHVSKWAGNVRKIKILYIHVNHIGSSPIAISQIRRQVDSLMRKYADELEVCRLRPVLQQSCGDMTNAVTSKKRERPRSIQKWSDIFFRLRQGRGLCIMSRVHLDSYLNLCFECGVLPQANDFLRGLLHKAARCGLIPRRSRTCRLLAPNPPARFGGACLCGPCFRGPLRGCGPPRWCCSRGCRRRPARRGPGCLWCAPRGYWRGAGLSWCG